MLPTGVIINSTAARQTDARFLTGSFAGTALISVPIQTKLTQICTSTQTSATDVPHTGNIFAIVTVVTVIANHKTTENDILKLLT